MMTPELQEEGKGKELWEIEMDPKGQKGVMIVRVKIQIVKHNLHNNNQSCVKKFLSFSVDIMCLSNSEC